MAAKGVTVLDDGTIADRRGSLNVDDEATPAQRNVLIGDGILKGYIQDAERPPDGRQPPATAGASYAHIPMPRMTNTYMLGGDKDPRKSSPASKGLYATNFGGGQVDITSGKFVFSASRGLWVENGRFSTPSRAPRSSAAAPSR